MLVTTRVVGSQSNERRPQENPKRLRVCSEMRNAARQCFVAAKIVYGDAACSIKGTPAMSFLQDPTTREGALEECLDEVNDCVTALDRYSPTTVAVAISVHLQTLLCALVESDLCTAQQVRDFVQELARDVVTELGASQPDRLHLDRMRPKPSA